MPRAKLTDRFVEQATCPPGKSRVRFMDSHPQAPHGFGLMVTENGARRFYLWGSANGRRVAVLLGVAGPGGISLTEARKAATAKRGELARGIDPVAAKRTARTDAARTAAEATRNGVTVRELLRLYIARKEGQLRERTTREYSRLIGLFRDARGADGALPFDSIASRPIASLIRADLVTWHEAESKRGRFQADKALAILRAAFRFAMAEESAPGVPLLDRDPSIGIGAAVRPHDRIRSASLVLDVPAESVAWALVGAFWRATAGLTLRARAFLRTLALLALRSGEAKALTWADLDLDGSVPLVRVPAPVRKGGRTTLTLPLPRQAVAELRALRDAAGSPGRVFAGVHLPTIAADLKHATALPWVRLHDLRRSLASGLFRLGYAPHVAGQVLGHKAHVTGALGHYVHGRAFEELRDALQAFADRVEAEAGRSVEADMSAALAACRAWGARPASRKG